MSLESCSKGMDCYGELCSAGIDYDAVGYAIISNVSGRTHTIQKGARVGQLIIMPVMIVDFVSRLGEKRDTGGLGSTGE